MQRRSFLTKLMQSSAGAAAASSAMGSLLLSQAAAAQSRGSGYKALVCVFLNGGNDSLNMIVPRDNAGHTAYAAARSGVGTGLALAQNTLLPITPLTNPSNGYQYGLHPAMPEMASLFAAGRIAVVANVGPLIEPITRPQFQNSSVPVPPQLFSHSDQQVFWQTSRPDLTSKIGWGGRIADLLHASNINTSLSMSLTLSGNNIFQTGNSIQPYALGRSGAIKREGYYDDPANGVFYPERRAAIDAMLAQSHSHPFERAFAQTQRRALDNYNQISNALSVAPTLTTVFPEDSPSQANLSAQLRMVARLISARSSLNQQRQVFFVQLGGFDFHDRHLQDQETLLRSVSRCLKAFYDATVELNVASLVTTFTASDFGRTLSINGDGTDHGWGGEHLVMGNAVMGQNIYGAMPNLTPGGPDDAGWGQLIPKIAVDQYAATLARWFGVSEGNIDTILPRLGMFPASGGRNLGFMAV